MLALTHAPTTPTTPLPHAQTQPQRAPPPPPTHAPPAPLAALSPARARSLARARLDRADRADRADLEGALGWFGGAAVVRRSLSTTNRGQLSCADEKVRGEQLKRKARARRRRRREGAVRAARRTGSVHRTSVLVLEVGDSARARRGWRQCRRAREACGGGKGAVRGE